MTLPGSTTVSYIYGAGTTHGYADEASRLERMEISSVAVAEYDYLGFGNVVGIEDPQPDVYQRKYGATSGTWPDLDRFGRVIKSRWTKDLSTDMDFFSLDISYDENSNPLTTEDNIYPAGFDVKYAIDGLDRLTDADEGTLSSGTIGSRTRRQEWPTLSQTGNWNLSKLDLNRDGAWAATNEYNDTRTHNVVNEILTRDTDTNGTANYTLTHDAAGNLTDDGKDYTYVYDAWYRLRQIKNRSTSAVVSEHQYYGNGFRAGEHYDSDTSGTVDSGDKWFWFGYDERWRIVATYRDTDASTKERLVHHTAGASGYGSGSYIDDLVLRERDANTSWNGAAGDETLEERLYYCQNWRHDVVALVTSGGALTERARYFSYGIPFGVPLGDCDGDGDTDAADQAILLGAWGTSTPKCNLDLDGTVDGADNTIVLAEAGATAGFEKLSRNRNRFGYAGYATDMAVNADWHVRNRVLCSLLGRWIRRDPIGYQLDASLYIYLADRPAAHFDPSGLMSNQQRVQDFKDCQRYVQSVVPKPPHGGVCYSGWANAIADCCIANDNQFVLSQDCARHKLQEVMPFCIQEEPLPPGAHPGGPTQPGWSDCAKPCWACLGNMIIEGGAGAIVAGACLLSIPTGPVGWAARNGSLLVWFGQGVITDLACLDCISCLQGPVNPTPPPPSSVPSTRFSLIGP